MWQTASQAVVMLGCCARLVLQQQAPLENEGQFAQSAIRESTVAVCMLVYVYHVLQFGFVYLLLMMQ